MCLRSLDEPPPKVGPNADRDSEKVNMTPLVLSELECLGKEHVVMCYTTA